MRSCVSIQDAERMAASTGMKERQALQLIATKIDEDVYNGNYDQLAKEVRLAVSSSISIAAGSAASAGVNMMQSINFGIVFILGYLLGMLSPRIVRFFKLKGFRNGTDEKE